MSQGGSFGQKGGGGGTVTSVSGTPNRVTSTGGSTPAIDIASNYVGQASITTLGTVTTGIWQATPIGATFGGTGQSTYATGDMLYASATNTLSKLPVAANTNVLTLVAGIPAWAPPATSGTVTSVTGTTDRITSTGGATPAIDIAATYVGQASITTLGTIGTGTWNATNIALNKGGTNAALTASNGGIFYSTATAGAILSGTATANQMLQSGASAAPVWSTATYPATTTINQLLYSSAANTVGGLASANSGVLTTSATGVPSIDTTNFHVLTTGVQVKGNNTNTAAPTGFIGEVVQSAIASGSAVLINLNTSTNITSISLTAGIWNVDCQGLFTPMAAANARVDLSINTTSATLGTDGDNNMFTTSSGGLGIVYPMCVLSYRLLLNATTTVYMVGRLSLAGVSTTGYGRITATRIG